jgi:hypothetical protein
MGKKKKESVVRQTVLKTPITPVERVPPTAAERKEIARLIALDDTDENMQAILKITDDKKVTFGKIYFSGNRGPYIVAFPNTPTAEYAEMNASEFKAVPLSEALKHTVLPIWECGAKDPEQINKLPKLDMKEFCKRSAREKEEKKLARAEKMKATKSKKEKKPKAKLI